jgi:arylsulfatase A-like enzyme
LVRAAPGPGGYTTEVLNNQALEFVRASAPTPDPFFLWLAHLAPHTTNTDAGTKCGSGAALNAPGTYRQWRDAPLPEAPSFGEKANRDKPLWIRSRAPIRKRQVAALTRAWRCSLASLTSVDRGVASLIRELKALGELDSTAIFFTSDNGYMYGEHRVVLQKIYPYEESWRVPLLARVPSAYLGGGEPPKFATQNVSNLDLTATVLDLADANPCATVPAGEDAQGCRPLDGRSLMPLLGAPGGAWPADRAILGEIGNRECGTVPGPSSGMKNHYDAIRTARYKYVELNRVNASNGACDRPEYELYDLKRDPYELKNLAVNPANRTPPAIQLNLANRLNGLRHCAGSSGRDAPVPDNYGSPRPLCE